MSEALSSSFTRIVAEDKTDGLFKKDISPSTKH